MDRFDRLTRSKNMSGVRSSNTRPELLIRKTLFKIGYRYRLHEKDLPGTPDIVFRGGRAVIFVNGCFWHGHSCRSKMPETNMEFWSEKINRNRRRDIENYRKLLDMGWRVLVVWECATKSKRYIDAAKLADSWLSEAEPFSMIEPVDVKSRHSALHSVNLMMVDIG